MTMTTGQQKVVYTKEKQGGALVPAGTKFVAKQPAKAKRR